MWRSLFLALGAFAIIVGAECLICDKAILAAKNEVSAQGLLANPQSAGSVARREIVPPEWAPWSLLSGGAVTMLYSFTIPKRVNT
jgi:hypothetical protein